MKKTVSASTAFRTSTSNEFFVIAMYQGVYLENRDHGINSGVL